MQTLNAFAIMVMLMASNSATAWPDPLAFSKDNGDELDTPTHTVNGVDRCDSDASSYPLLPDECHRWGLVWNTSVGNPTDVWKPGDVKAGYRLPTIKELVKLFDYTGGRGFAINDLIYSKLTPNDKNWLLSSSYRDIDGKYDIETGLAKTGRLQIFAINTLTGEVRAFEPGKKTGKDGLQMCTALANNGDCTLDASHSYFTLLVKQVRLK